MESNGLVLDILYAVITAVVPVLAAFIARYVKAAAGSLRDSDAVLFRQLCLDEVARAVTDAVAMTSQTYVDTLKQHGTFNEDAQREAATKALQACIGALSEPTAKWVTETFGNIQTYLGTRIEAEVRKQKTEV